MFTDDLTIFDYSVLAILVLSILLSMVRGVVREILSLAGWVVAFMVANSFAAGFAPLLPSGISGESLRLLLAFAALFLSSLLAMGLITMLISALVKTVGLGFADRFMGSLFGFARGLLVVLLMVLAAGLTALPQEPFWKKAVLSKPLEMAAMMVIPWLPRDLSKRISYVKTEA
ncbi:CvpA family protein [Nitrosospira briensis]|uniref:Membrane protein required for colicin V production n=1 Tax=Nitrosospira briensis TaxID=35799 RepID=A0A1I5DEU0_9PROT|nr:CvpA family protein [Nitrosospira briensis]SFN97765.1 membrane protein required for colicin V production [Nitrosospira briensis]SFO20490.1 membrane protein required for colicin V production [Nitrosospira briensis]